MDPAIELVVFADDWGRHPSSAQHLVGELLRQGLVERLVWVNTIGMRRPRLRWGDVTRGVESLR
ncbi:MAG: glycosyltransferase family 1 protein, partial [Planctomycetota bacterium]